VSRVSSRSLPKSPVGTMESRHCHQPAPGSTRSDFALDFRQKSFLTASRSLNGAVRVLAVVLRARTGESGRPSVGHAGAGLTGTCRRGRGNSFELDQLLAASEGQHQPAATTCRLGAELTKRNHLHAGDRLDHQFRQRSLRAQGAQSWWPLSRADCRAAITSGGRGRRSPAPLPDCNHVSVCHPHPRRRPLDAFKDDRLPAHGCEKPPGENYAPGIS